MKKEVEDYLKLKDIIHSKAMELLEEYNYIKPIYGYDYLKVMTVDETDIEYRGDEYWQYGGHEPHEFTLPTKYLYTEWKQQFYDEMREQERIQIAAQNTKKELERQAKIKEYEKLAKELGLDVKT